MADNDEFPIFRPRFGRRQNAADRARSSRFRSALLASVHAAGGIVRRRAPTRAGRTGVAVRMPTEHSRRVVVKVRVVKMTQYGRKAAALHLRYVERDGVEKDGSKGVLYGPDGPARADSFEEPRPKEKHQFRVILSPEDGEQLDLTSYVRRYMARVAHLESLRLATRTSATSWVLAGDWARHLKESGARGQMHASLRGDSSRYRILSPDQDVPPADVGVRQTLYGRVAGKGLPDELAGKYYAVVETPDGFGYHVPIDRRSAEALRVGDLVALEAKPDRPGVVVRKEPLALQEQVAHRGPVLLDQLETMPLAPYGFGIDVRAAIESRKRVLRDLGVDPATPNRIGHLRELERQAFGQRVAARSGQTFVSETPPVFQGRIPLVDRAGDGTAYAVVTDGRRFVVLKANDDLQCRVGRTVRSPNGPRRARPRRATGNSSTTSVSNSRWASVPSGSASRDPRRSGGTLESCLRSDRSGGGRGTRTRERRLMASLLLACRSRTIPVEISPNH